jgi:hypothetical protein
MPREFDTYERRGVDESGEGVEEGSCVGGGEGVEVVD